MTSTCLHSPKTTPTARLEATIAMTHKPESNARTMQFISVLRVDASVDNDAFRDELTRVFSVGLGKKCILLAWKRVDRGGASEGSKLVCLEFWTTFQKPTRIAKSLSALANGVAVLKWDFGRDCEDDINGLVFHHNSPKHPIARIESGKLVAGAVDFVQYDAVSGAYVVQEDGKGGAAAGVEVEVGVEVEAEVKTVDMESEKLVEGFNALLGQLALTGDAVPPSDSMVAVPSGERVMEWMSVIRVGLDVSDNDIKREVVTALSVEVGPQAERVCLLRSFKVMECYWKTFIWTMRKVPRTKCMYLYFTTGEQQEETLRKCLYDIGRYNAAVKAVPWNFENNCDLPGWGNYIYPINSVYPVDKTATGRCIGSRPVLFEVVSSERGGLGEWMRGGGGVGRASEKARPVPGGKVGGTGRREYEAAFKRMQQELGLTYDGGVRSNCAQAGGTVFGKYTFVDGTKYYRPDDKYHRLMSEKLALRAMFPNLK